MWLSISNDEQSCVHVGISLLPLSRTSETCCKLNVHWSREKHTLNRDCKVLFVLSKDRQLISQNKAGFRNERQKRWCVMPSFSPTKASSTSCSSVSEWLSRSASHVYFLQWESFQLAKIFRKVTNTNIGAVFRYTDTMRIKTPSTTPQAAVCVLQFPVMRPV